MISYIFVTILSLTWFAIFSGWWPTELYFMPLTGFVNLLSWWHTEMAPIYAWVNVFLPMNTIMLSALVFLALHIAVLLFQFGRWIVGIVIPTVK